MLRTSRIRLAACALLAAGLMADASAHVFLRAPNGGELLTVGSRFTIDWQIAATHPTQNWDLYYSTTGPNGPWLPIALDLPMGPNRAGAQYTYEWRVPDTPSTNVRIRVVQDNIGRNYDDVSDNDLAIVPASATFTTFASGCGAGPVAAPTLGAVGASLPEVGHTFDVAVGGLGSGATLVATWVGRRLASPVDLGAAGMPGCTQFVDAAIVAAMPLASPTSSVAFALPVPADVRFVGLAFGIQALVVDGAVTNALGAVISNPGEGVIGSR